MNKNSSNLQNTEKPLFRGNYLHDSSVSLYEMVAHIGQIIGQMIFSRTYKPQ